MRILEDIFAIAEKTDNRDIYSSPFSGEILGWLRANASPQIRNALSSLLLPPLIRSYRVRSILGRTSHKRIFNDLESVVLTPDGDHLPNVLGTYALYGPRLQDPASTHHLPDEAYVGKSSACQPDLDGDFGIRCRSKQHYRSIQQAVHKRIVAAYDQRSYPTVQDRDVQAGHGQVLYCHQQLAGETVGLVKLAILSVFPYPAGGFGGYVLHLTFIMALAETIDTIFLGTLSSVKENSLGRTRFAAWYSEAYRPKDMPVPAFQGLNRALSLKQACRPYGALPCPILWSQSDIDTMIRVVRENETRVYNHSGTHKIQWNVLIRLLHEQGVAKTDIEIRNMHHHLSMVRTQHPTFVSFSVSRWKFLWAHVYLLKEHLEQHELVSPPKNENDLYFHIPALEDGRDTISDLSALLCRTNFEHDYKKAFIESFLNRYLPSLLHKDVWKMIKGKSHPASPDTIQDYEIVTIY